MPAVTVNPQEEYLRAEALRAKQERTIASQFELFIRRATSPEILQQVETMVTTRSFEPILKSVNIYIEQFSNVLEHAYIQSGEAEIGVWLKRFGVLTKAGEFHVTRREVSEFLSTSRRNFIENLTRQQRSAVRQAVITGINTNKTPKQIARMFEDVIGLGPAQEKMVQSYRRSLESGSRSALQRELRNTRYDARVSTAVLEGEVIPQKQIDNMVKAYARNLKRFRATVIAQTESLRMVNYARDEAVKQAAAAAGMDTKESTKIWNTTLDGRERPSHRAMDGQEVGIDEVFVSPSGAHLLYPGDTSQGAGAAEIINCRCSVSYHFKEIS